MNKKGLVFETMPYADRQIIIVLDDEVLAAKRKAEEEAKKKNKKFDWKLTTKIFFSIADPAISFYYSAMSELIKAIINLRKLKVKFLEINRSDAALLLFPPGHPRNKVVYVGHPAQWKVYYPFSVFHRKVFEHKFSETIKFLVELGAIEIEIERTEGYTSEFAASLGISIPSQQPVDAKAKVGSKRITGKQAKYKATYEPRKEIYVSDNLVWFPHEPTWQQIADGRLHHRLREFTLNLLYDDDFGINCELKIQVSKVGLDIGGNFHEFRSTVWKIKGKFS